MSTQALSKARARGGLRVRRLPSWRTDSAHGSILSRNPSKKLPKTACQTKRTLVLAKLAHPHGGVAGLLAG